MTANKTEELKAAFEQFKNCLNRENLMAKSIVMAGVGAGIGGYFGNIPGALVGGLVGYGISAVGIGYNCHNQPQVIDKIMPTPRLPAIQTGPEQIRG